MDILKTQNGFAIKVPFALKDAFRQAFPSAKWNAELKQWEVGPRSGARLEQWVEQVASVEQDLSELEAALLNEQEMERLRQTIDRVRSDTAAARRQIEAAGAQTERLASLRLMLSDEQAQFAEVAAALKAAEAKAHAAASDVAAFIGTVIDYDAIAKAKAQMRRWHHDKGATARGKFDEAQAVMLAEREKLKQAGWGLRGLNFMAAASFNRPDRDHVDLMPADAMLDLYKLDEPGSD